MDKLVILTGPTAVGKTDISIKLAKEINGEIISADSAQVYKHMNIGSAKITPEEMKNVPHHLIDILDPNDEFNVFLFKKMAMDAINDIVSREKIPIIVGGTGFYIQSVLYDINFEESDVDNTFRKKLEDLQKQKGNEYLHSLLKDIDPVSYESIHPNNVKKVIRALEFYEENQYPISEHNSTQRQNDAVFDFAYYVLNNDRDILYDRINKRVDIMFEQGLLDEVNQLKQMGYNRSLQSMQAIGYKEVFAYLDGECSLDDCKTTIKTNTRHFAKRQLTWFRREKYIQEVNYADFNQNQDLALEYILKDLKQKNII